MQDNNIKTKGEFKFSYWKILTPVIIGIGVVVWMMFRDTQSQDFGAAWQSIDFNFATISFIILAWMCMIGRDFGLSWRFRALTDKQISWKQAIKVNCLCEFTSCVTPSAVGGSSFAIFYLNHEGINFGRATTLVFSSIFLDELFFVVICPIIYLLTPEGELFKSDASMFSQGLELTFWCVYAAITAWTMILLWGVVINPKGIQKATKFIFSLRYLRRWQPQIESWTDNMANTSKELKQKRFAWWLKAFCATFLSWTSRFLTVCAIFAAFIPGCLPEQWLIFARQIVVWVVLIAVPTPGGSGVSEWLFTEFYASLIPSFEMALILAISWRIISYYIYLLIGATIIPKWISESYYRINKPTTKA